MGQQYNPQFPVNLGKPPVAEQSPRVVTTTLQFNASTPPASITDNLTVESMENAINNVQSIWIDNNNAGTFTITFLETGQTLRVKGNTQGFYPVLCFDQVNYTASHATASAKVFLAFYNAPAPYVNWLTA